MSMDERVAERVLRAVERVPSGQVVSYGDVAAVAGTGARQVGRVMRHWGSNVAWWRVTDRDGRLPAELLRQALPHWRAEGIAVAADGRGCRIRDHRADLQLVADAWADATADLD